MMDDNIRVIQFFIKEGRSEKCVLDSINSLLTYPIRSTDFDVPNSSGFLLLNNYTNGFKQGICISLVCDMASEINEEDFIKKLANILNTDILLQIDDDEENPWALAFPNNPVLEKVYVDFLDDGVDIRKD